MNPPTYIDKFSNRHRWYNNCPRIIFDIGSISGSKELSEDTLKIFMQRGITALYTDSGNIEALQVIGSALKECSGEKPFVAVSISPGEGMDITRSQASEENAVTAMVKSAGEMGISRIDLLIVSHPPLLYSEIRSVYNSLVQLKNEGVVGMVGLAGFKASDYQDIFQKAHIDLFVGYNRLDGCNLDALEEDIPVLEGYGIGYISSSPLHSQLLGSRLGQYSREQPSWKGLSARDITVAVMASRIAAKNNITIEEMGYRYLLGIGESTMVIADPASLKELDKILGWCESGPIDNELFNEITDNILNFYK